MQYPNTPVLPYFRRVFSMNLFIYSLSCLLATTFSLVIVIETESARSSRLPQWPVTHITPLPFSRAFRNICTYLNRPEYAAGKTAVHLDHFDDRPAEVPEIPEDDRMRFSAECYCAALDCAAQIMNGNRPSASPEDEQEQTQKIARPKGETVRQNCKGGRDEQKERKGKNWNNRFINRCLLFPCLYSLLSFLFL